MPGPHQDEVRAARMGIQVKMNPFLSRWTAHGQPLLRTAGQALVMHPSDGLPNRYFVNSITAMTWELQALDLSCEVVVESFQALSP